jgi:hypothetical protein
MNLTDILRPGGGIESMVRELGLAPERRGQSPNGPDPQRCLWAQL